MTKKHKKKPARRFPSKHHRNSDLFDQAIAHYQAGHLKKAEECCRALLTVCDHHPDALHLLGMIHQQYGDDLMAINFIKKAISISSDKFFYHLNLGNIFHSIKNYAEADTCYRKALELNQKFVPTIIHMAQNLEQNQRAQEAIGYYKKALALEPNNPRTLTGLGNALLAAGKIEDSIAILRQLVKAAPLAESYYNLGGALMNSGDVVGAAQQYQKSLELRPDFIDAYYNLEISREKLSGPNKQLPETISYYKKALSNETNHPRALAGLGKALLDAGKVEESITTLHKLVKTSPDSADSYFNLGQALKRTGDLEEAKVSFNQALSLRPMYGDAHYNLGIIFNEQARVAEAIRCFKKALTCKPDFPETQIRLAIFAWVNGDWQDCRYYLNLISNNAKKLTWDAIKFVPPFYNFLDKLLKYRELFPAKYIKGGNLPILYVVGDSHCLSTANTKMNFRGVDYLALAKMVFGCKAWHLSNKDKNQYKYTFEKTIETIPEGSSVILLFGEIDCRIDEGIIKHYNENNVDLTESITHLVDNYLNYILRVVNSKALFPVICNVPARLLCKDQVSGSDKKLQKKVLAIFNKALAEHVRKKKIPLLDIYTPTNAQEGNHESVCHIDGNHLLPSVFENLIKKL